MKVKTHAAALNLHLRRDPVSPRGDASQRQAIRTREAKPVVQVDIRVRTPAVAHCPLPAPLPLPARVSVRVCRVVCVYLRPCHSHDKRRDTLEEIDQVRGAEFASTV